MGELMKKKEAAVPGSSRRRTRGDAKPAERAGRWTAEDEEMLAQIRKRLATFSIRRSSVPALVETVTLKVTVAADAKPGKRELRLQTEQGISNPLAFIVGQLPEITEESARSMAVAESQKRGGRGRRRQQTSRPDPGSSPTSSEPEYETEINLPATVNGQILPGDVDRYRFRRRKGQQLVVNVSARCLIPYLSDAVPGWFQAVVSLLDADGNEITYEDDFHFHPDPVLYCKIPADGKYVVEIRDALYRGREDFVYRVALGELPFVTSVFPLGGQSGTETDVELSGWNLGERTLTVPSQEAGVRMISVRNGKLFSNHVPFAVDTLPEFPEEESNDDAATAQRVTFPAIINGRIDHSDDVDVFCFERRAGAWIVAEVLARRLNSPLDSVIKLTNEAGEQLSLSDDYEDKASGLTTHHADSQISARISNPGLYYIHLGDAQQQGGDAYSYRLRIAPRRPDFRLHVVPSNVNARAGTTVPITVHAMRKDGFDGDIMLALKDAPTGFTLAGGRIPAGQDAIRATLTVPPEAMNPVPLSLAGQAVIQRRTVTRLAVPADDMMQAFIYRHLVPAEDLQVAVTGTPRRSAQCECSRRAR